MMETNQKIYCTRCGQEHEHTDQYCGNCGYFLHDKDHLLREYLINHTKAKLQGSVEDKIFETIKNFLLSHLYGMVMTVTLAAALVTAVAAHPAPRAQKVDARPVSVSQVVMEGEAPAATPMPVPTATPEPTPEPVQTPVYDFETQADVMLANYALWEKPDEYAMQQSYYVTDLDQDGLLEINSTTIMGTGFFSSRVSYEVNETMDGLVQVAYGTEFGESDLVFSEPDDFITLDPAYAGEDDILVGYYDPETKDYRYIVADTWRAGWVSHGVAYAVLTMTDNNYDLALLGTYESNVDSDSYDETKTYKIGETVYEDEATFRAAMVAQFDGYRKFTYSIDYLSSYDITNLDAQIRELVRNYKLKLL